MTYNPACAINRRHQSSRANSSLRQSAAAAQGHLGVAMAYSIGDPITTAQLQFPQAVQASIQPQFINPESSISTGKFAFVKTQNLSTFNGEADLTLDQGH